MIRKPSPSRRVMAIILAAPFLVAACTTAADEPTAAPGAGTTEDAAPVANETTTSRADEGQAEVAEASGWLDIELTDAASGESYTLASLAGQVVAIEPMAIWCSNCKAQQDNVKSAYPQLDTSEVTYISLGIDPGEDQGALATYAERRGYEWTFSTSPVEFSRALSDLFGPQILSVPSTPLIVLDPSGEVVFQDFGFHGPERLLEILEEAAA